jgi:hypothetical protein
MPCLDSKDIDSRFAIIWLHNRMQSITTMQEQQSLCEEAFRKQKDKIKQKFTFTDLFAVPGYQSYIRGAEWTEHNSYVAVRHLMTSCTYNL